MRLYNTKSNQVEPFVPRIPGQVSMYVCGPTVYNHPHIGNARPIVVFDVLRRVLEAQDLHVHFVSNFTDVDDKIITRALEENVKEEVITARYIDAYNDVRQRLFSKPLEATPKVTETMDGIIKFIEKLIENNAAYVVGDNVYFRVSQDVDYGSLSHQNLEQLRVGARIEENEEKENPLDFVLWKKTTQGITWPSPWGEGRPGWHTECVVMIDEVFNQEIIDIHGGGQDLRFPHHENECAQCRMVYHRDIANYWVHNAMLNLDGVKMSKSLGNVQWAKDYLDDLGNQVTRWLLLSTHYRMNANLSEETIHQAKTEVNKIETALKQAYVQLALRQIPVEGEVILEYWNGFMDAMNDDLNTPNAIMVLFDLIKKCNQVMRHPDFDIQELQNIMVTLEAILDVLGLSFERPEFDDVTRSIYLQWTDAKKAKDFDEADRLRKILFEKGVL